MKITQVEIQNIRGIDALGFAPNTLTVISGKNGTGKSSVTAALTALVAGGHDPTLLRKGAESGRVSVIFDDGQSLTLTVTATKTERAVRDAKGRKISAPMSIIAEMTNAVSFDPLLFLEAKEVDQLKLLLEALPIRITAEELKAAQIPLVKGVNLDAHGLVVLNELHKAFYDERRDLAREAKSKKTTIEELSAGLPEPNAEVEVALGVAQTELQSLLDERQQAVAALTHGERDAGRTAEDALREAKAQIESKLAADILALRTVAQSEIDSLQRADKLQATARRDTYAASHRDVQTRYDESIQSKQEAVGKLKAEAGEAQRAEGQRRTIAKMKTEAEALETEIEGLNASLASVAKLKQTVTANLPIPGLEIQDGSLFIDGIPLSTVNSADKILGVAVQIGMLRMKANGLPFMVIDNGERLDSAHRATLKQIAEAKGLQVILSTVTDEPELRIA